MILNISIYVLYKKSTVNLLNTHFLLLLLFVMKILRLWFKDEDYEDSQNNWCDFEYFITFICDEFMQKAGLIVKFVDVNI